MGNPFSVMLFLILMLYKNQFSYQHLSAEFIHIPLCLLAQIHNPPWPPVLCPAPNTLTYTVWLFAQGLSRRLPLLAKTHERFLHISSPHTFIRPPTSSSSVPSSSIIFPISVDFQDLTSFSLLQPTVYTANVSMGATVNFSSPGNWDH